ncbi:LPXTG cell wall anchor domain-containing protein [Lactobacillus sp. B3795]|uniref:LPXTG cell wall anchor domain-containing protein n=1 Tax=Lactobacillus sp. B3795 TaxID=2818036 RepID=UPI00265CCB61|nr:LPXTG cell wall anchor domain-containing protein [Lactobacillus sp. B3795]MCX8743742.1 LPXTG cell wall anchor domain-containing protein [Lactobacillus sp. B3795]
MKQSFDNNKNSNRSKISKKWIYAAAVTGVLITGAKAAQNTDNGSIDAKAATAKKATSVQVYVIDDRGIQVYPNGLKLTVNGKGKFDLSTLYTSLTGGITQYDASEVKAAMNNNTVDGSQSSYTFHVKNLTNPVASSSASQQSSAAQQSSSASESSASNDSSAQSSNASQSSNESSSVDSSSAAQSSASDSNNGSSSANNSSSAQGSTSNSGSSNSTSSNDANATKTVKVVVYNAMNPSDYVPFDVTVPYDSTVLDLKKIPYPNQNSGNSSIYDFMISNWGVDPESISTNPTIEDDGNGNYSARFSDYHIKTDKTFNFVDSNQNVAYSKTIQANNDAPYDISDVLNSVPSYLVLDPTNDMVKTHSFRAQESAPETYTINVNYQKTLSIDDDNNNPTGMKARFTSNSSTLTADQFKARLAGQGFQVVNPNDLPDPINFANSDSYAIKLIKNSLPISFVDQHGNVVYSTNLPSSAINQPVSIKDVLNTVTKKGVTPDSSNSIVSNQAVPAFYKDQSVKINVTAPVSNLTINFVDKSTGKVVDSLQKDNVTDFDNISIADKVNSLKSQNYAPELSSLSSQFNSQTYDNFQAQYVLNPAIKDEGNGNHVATIYVDSTVATPANTNKTGEGYAMKFKDANGNTISLTVNSANPTIAPKELQKALADQGYTLSQDDINKLGDTPVDLTDNNGDTGLTIAPNANSNSVYPKTVSFVDADGKTKTAIVNIKSDNPSMDTNALAKALADQGYTLTDAEKAKLGQNTDLSSTDPITVTPNADASTTKSYPQSLTYTDGNGQTHDVSVSINSKTPTMSKDDYINALEDKGYKLTDDQKNKLSDSVDLSAITTPLVIANPNAPISYTQTLKDDKGNDVTVNIKSETPQISADDYKKQLAAQGVTLSEDAQKAIGNNQVDLSDAKPAYTVITSTDANKATAYPQTVNVKQEDGSYKPKTVSITSATSTMSKDDYVKALKDLGYDVQNSENIPANVDLTNANNAYKVNQPTDAPTSYQQTVVLPDGTNAKVNINSKSSTIDKDDLAKELAAQGYVLPDNAGVTYPLDLTKDNSINVKPNAQAVTNYPQTVKVANEDGTFTNKTVYVPSANGSLSASEYVKAMLDNGYTVANPSALSDPLSVAVDNVNPVVIPNASAHAVQLNVKQSDGTTKEITVNVGSQNSYLNKSDFVNAVSAQGYTIADMDSLPASIDLSAGKAYDATPNASSYTNTLNSSDGKKSPVVKHDTPLITKQDLINQLKDQGLNVSDTGKLNDVLNLTNSDDMKKVASLIEGFTTYKMNVGVVGTGDTISVSGNSKTISKQDFINRVEADGYKLMNPDALNDTLDLTNPDDFKGLIISKAGNVEGNRNESNTSYSQDAKIAGSNDTVKVESQNKTMTKDEFVKYLDAKGYKVADESKLPETIDLTKPLSDIELVSNKDQSASNNDADKNQASNDKDADKGQESITYGQDFKVAGSNDTIKVESQNETMTKDEFVKYLNDKGYKVADESKLPETIDLTEPLSDIELVSDKNQASSNNDADKNQASSNNDADKNQASSNNDADKNQASSNNDADKNQAAQTYAQDVKVAGSNDVVKVESANKTMTKDEFVKELDDKGYKVADESKLPETIDLTKPVSDIEAVSNNTQASSNNDSDKNQASNKTDADKNQANKVYVQNVKVAGSNKTIKVESSKKTMTKAEFVKYLASKGYKVADESQLPSTIDLTKSLGDIKVVAKKAASKKTTKKSNKETEKNASAKEVNGHRGQFANKKEAGKLPQTGDETNQRNLFGFGLISMVLGFILAIFGLRRKNK